MRRGLTEAIDNIIEPVSELECIKDYILCGGTALAIQLGHRKSEDLDFMKWRNSRTDRPEVDWPAISKEIEANVGPVDNMDILGFDQVIFLVKGVRISFYISDKYMPKMEKVPYLGNIQIASPDAILAMKLEVMLRRMKLRDYYDVYSILKAGGDIKKGIADAIDYSQYRLKTKNLVAMLLSDNFDTDSNFKQLSPIYDSSIEEMRDYILQKLK